MRTMNDMDVRLNRQLTPLPSFRWRMVNLLVFENFFWILPDDVNRIMSKKIYYKSFYQNKGENF